MHFFAEKHKNNLSQYENLFIGSWGLLVGQSVFQRLDSEDMEYVQLYVPTLMPIEEALKGLFGFMKKSYEGWREK